MQRKINKNIESILIVRLSAFGDCICAIPVYNALRKYYKEAKITWVIQDNNLQLIENLYGLDNTILFPRKQIQECNNVVKKLKLLKNFRKQLLSNKYDLSIDLQSNTKSSFIAWLSKTPIRLGHGKGEAKELSLLFNNINIPPNDNQKHIVLRNLNLLKILDVDEESPDFTIGRNEISYSNINKWMTNNCVNRNQFILLVPFCGRKEKEWSIENYRKLSQYLYRKKIQTVILNSPGSEHLTKTIVDPSLSSFVKMAPKTSLSEMMEIIRSSKLLVGGDTGPLQLAGALNIPSITLFGPTDPERHRPWNSSTVIPLSKEPEYVFELCQNILTKF